MGIFSKSILDDQSKWVQGFLDAYSDLTEARGALGEWTAHLFDLTSERKPIEEFLASPQIRRITHLMETSSTAAQRYKSWRSSYPTDETEAKTPTFALATTCYKFEENAQALVFGARLEMVKILRTTGLHEAPEYTSPTEQFNHGWTIIKTCPDILTDYLTSKYQTAAQIRQGWETAGSVKKFSSEQNAIAQKLVSDNMDTLKWLTGK